MIRKTNKQFIKDSKVIHGSSYDYSKTNYVTARLKVKIICNKCGQGLYILPNNHISGNGCNKCFFKRNGEKKRLGKNNFIERCIKIHGDTYDYSKTDYIVNREDVKIICSIHGSFWQSPLAHLRGSGCKKCYCDKKKLGQQEFIKRCIKIHGNTYDYSGTVYNEQRESIDIICKKHGLFKQSAGKHLLGQGCCVCNESLGEKTVAIFLDNKGIAFEREKKFDDCRNIRKLKFDFYLKKYNMIIEYDGGQHFYPVSFGGMSKSKTEKCFKKIQNNDKIKNDYCKKNNIKLIRISYKDFNKIDKILGMKL